MFVIPIEKLASFKYHKDGTQPTTRYEIFVFGSNESGIHGAGAARAALDKYGAVWGVGFGQTGQSFAIPTKDWIVESLPLEVIEMYVKRFVAYTLTSSDEFFITRVGCGLAGYKDRNIAPFFKGCNKATCNMPEEWMDFLE